MNAKLLIDGKEFDIEILDPKLQELLAPSKKRTGYEEDVGGVYYYDNGMGAIDCESHECNADDDCYKAANYYYDKSVAENNVRADKLMRQLRRFAVEHREGNVDLLNSKWYEIYYDYNTNSINIEDMADHKYFGTILFNTYDNAQLAIKTFCDELIWYFTEYKDSL
jgi:hypothetical protein